MHDISKKFSALESKIADLADMASVTVILLEHHERQILALKGMDLTGKQVIEQFELHSQTALTFGVYQINSMENASLRKQYYANDPDPA